MAFENLDSVETLAQLIEESNTSPVVLFKHSITCPISTDASTQMSIVSAPVNIVIVQTSRPVSNEIERVTGIRHESPQLIILKDGKAVFSASHYSITADTVEAELKKLNAN